jgi:hypothetical protein
MKSRTFKGKYAADINKQVWDWRSADPTIKVKQEHPIERLAVDVRPARMGTKIEAPDLVSMRADYEE